MKAQCIALHECGGLGGRQQPGDDELKLEVLPLLALEQLIFATIASMLVQLVGHFYMPPLLLRKMLLQFLSKKLLKTNKFLHFLV